MDELQQARVEIDAVDQEMARLFERRMAACRQVAQYKKERGLPILDANREAAVIERGAQRVEEPDLREYYICFLRDVMKTSRSYQSRLNEGMKVIYAGVEGAFGYIASKRAFPEAKLTAASDFTEAYRAVEAGEYDCAVLPIENSYAGDVGAVMDLMFSGSLYVNRMIELEVEHNLLGCHGAKLNEIRTVVSHPQALEQCAEFIRSHGWQTLSYSNTALAAQYVAEPERPHRCRHCLRRNSGTVRSGAPEQGHQRIPHQYHPFRRFLPGTASARRGQPHGKRAFHSGVHHQERGGRAGPAPEYHRRARLQYAQSAQPPHEEPDLELLFLCGGRRKYQQRQRSEYAPRTFSRVRTAEAGGHL